MSGETKEERLNNGLQVRTVARVLDLHENTIRNMMDDHRLEWYYLNGRDGTRRIIASSVREFLLRNVTPDWCGLCSLPMSSHEVGTETIMVGGRAALRPIGWMCPARERPDPPKGKKYHE